MQCCWLVCDHTLRMRGSALTWAESSERVGTNGMSDRTLVGTNVLISVVTATLQL